MTSDKEYDLLIKNVRMVRPNLDSIKDGDIAVKDGKIHLTGVNLNADIALVDPGETWFIHSEESESGQGYTPFEGFALDARVKTTFLRGRRIYDNGTVIGEPTGRFLRRPY